MRTLARICAAYDFSPGADSALLCATTLVRAYKASIHLLHVVEPPALYARALVTGPRADADAAANRALERLQEIIRGPVLAGLPVSCEVRIGTPFAEIIVQAREFNADLIVVGDTPPTGVAHRLLGGTAERVLRKSTLPVLIGKHALGGLPATILAPTDFSDASLPALIQAATLARQWGARLLITHVIEPAAEVYGWGAELTGGKVYWVEPEALEPEWRVLLNRLPLSNVRWDQVTLKGFAVETLVSFAAEQKADLVVLGTHGRSALPHALLGSVAEGVARRASCCVMSVRHDAFAFSLP